MPKTGDMMPAGGERLLWREAMRDVKPLRGREPAILSPPLPAPAETGCVVKPHRLPGLDRFHVRFHVQGSTETWMAPGAPSPPTDLMA